MEKELAEAIAILEAQGITVAANPTASHADIYVATVPDGEKYEFDSAGLLNLKAEEKLDLEGLQDAHLARKKTPNLS